MIRTDGESPIQTPCPCPVCVDVQPEGCYGADSDRIDRAGQKCYEDECACWGGHDHECEAHWLWLK